MGSSPFYFAPMAGTSVGKDDNLFLSPQNPRSSWLWLVNAGAGIDSRGPSRVVQLSYLGTYGRYTSSQNDNYTDHTVLASFDALATRELAFRLGYEFLRGHDPRGSTDRPASNRPDKYDSNKIGAVVAYGQRDATGRVEAFYSDARKRYQNNPTFTAGSDRDTQEFGGAFYFRVAPRTQLLAEYRKTDYEYRLSTSPLSSEEERIYGGVTWDATAQTTGTIKVGQLKKKFDIGPSSSDTGWEAQVSWMPRSYSKFDLYSSRNPVESTGEGAFILSDATGLVWTHDWNSVWTTAANVRFQNDKYQGLTPRKDEVTSLGLKATYKMRRWLTLGAEYTYTNRDSNSPINEYDRNLWLLTVTGTM
jgi:hypothetical protein